ncbi:MAG: LptF/LptG family permease [Gemmatimonadales bacterium]
MQRLTRTTTRALLAFLDAPRSWRHGYDLMKAAGLSSGTLYPLLARLADDGLLESRWEEPRESGRPPRQLYRLTAAGRVRARQAVERADASWRLASPPSRSLTVPGNGPLALPRLLERLAKLAPPRHRDLARGMVAELEAIDDPAERRRFALGAATALARLALGGVGRAISRAPADRLPVRHRRPTSGEHPMPTLTTGQLLRRHAAPFIVSFASLTGFLLARFALRQAPELSARGLPADRIGEAVLMAVPFTIALTIPMAVFLSVAWAFSRLAAEGTLATA